jgi:hypothetical protein
VQIVPGSLRTPHEPKLFPHEGRPEGCAFEPEIEEAAFLNIIKELPFGAFRMHGVDAERRIVRYGVTMRRVRRRWCRCHGIHTRGGHRLESRFAPLWDDRWSLTRGFLPNADQKRRRAAAANLKPRFSTAIPVCNEWLCGNNGKLSRIEPSFEIRGSPAAPRIRQLGWRAGGNHLTARFSRAWPHVDNVVARRYHIQIVLDDNHRIA